MNTEIVELRAMLKESVSIVQSMSDLVGVLNEKLLVVEMKLTVMEDHHHKLPDTPLGGGVVTIGGSTGGPLYPGAKAEA